MTFKHLFLSTIVSLMLYAPNLNAQLPDVEIMHERRSDKSISFTYRKNKPGTYYLNLEFPDLKNANHGDHQQILDHDFGNLTVLRPINREEEVGYSYTFSYIRGLPNPEVDSTFKYLLPIKPSQTARIVETTQQNAITAPSASATNWISYIITKGESFPVHAMRKGVVVEVRDATTDSLSPDQRNSIMIEHMDGTYANYQGVQSMQVAPGEKVFPGQHLGNAQSSGNQKYRLDFYINYIYSEKFEGNRKNALKNDEANFKFLKPVFYTENYTGTIDSGKEYRMEVTEEVFTQDFTRRNLRKFRKDPQQFNWSN